VHCLAEGSVAVGAAANGREAARSAVAGHLGVAGSAEAVAVGLALGETKEAAGTIDRLAEAQNIAVAGHIRSSLGVEGKSYHLVVDFRSLTSVLFELESVGSSCD
jgi:hypothetical protein